MRKLFLLLSFLIASAFADTDSRIEHYSAQFLGRPYGFTGPLGEGPTARYDQDPLYRFDTFDCTTYVETVIALSLATSNEDFKLKINEIRYEDGVVDYLKRNHFTDLQWIPANIKNGMLSEINDQIVPLAEIHIARALTSFQGTLRLATLEMIQVPGLTPEKRLERLQELRSLKAPYPDQYAEVPYVSISYLIKNPNLLRNIPSGTIVNFVRPNWDLTTVAGTHQNISHQAILVRIGKTLYQRHASPSGTKSVEEIPFIEYLKKFENHATLKGVHFMKVN